MIYYKESTWECSSTLINETTDVQYNTTDVRETMEEQNTSETNLSFEITREIVHEEITIFYTDKSIVDELGFRLSLEPKKF